MKRRILKPWSKGEDEAIIRAMGTLTNNMTQEQTFENLAKRLNRTTDSIKNRWYREIKPNLDTKSFVKTKEEELLEYAKKTYPIGAIVKSNITGTKFIVSECPKYSNIKTIQCIGMDYYNNNAFSTFTLYNDINKKWAEIIGYLEKESTQQSTKVKEKGVFLNIPRLEKLSISFLKEIASAKVETASKKELIDIIVD